MKITPFFSVIIPVYNSKCFVEKAINSVLKQVYANFELIIIDDGSTDNTLEIIKSFADSRLKVFCKSNGGVASARNYGLNEAVGRYIAFLDADDVWSDMHLQFAYDFFKSNTDIMWFCNRQEIVKGINKFKASTYTNYSLLNFHRKGLPFISSSNITICKRLIDYVGKFPEDCKYGEDTVYWYRIGYHEPILGFGETVSVQVLDHSNSSTKFISRTNLPLFKCVDYRQDTYIRHNKALAGIILSLLIYHIKNKDVKSFISLFKIMLKEVSFLNILKITSKILITIFKKV
jgi:glycosyltransferase involved in cell wall biosynthesis